jgi:hypothetical protein
VSRKHRHRGRVNRHEHRADRLQLHADQFGRQSARRFGVVVSLAGMAELRATIAAGALPDTVRRVGRKGFSAEAYCNRFSGVTLLAVYDRRGQSIAAFLPADAPEILPKPASAISDEV